MVNYFFWIKKEFNQNLIVFNWKKRVDPEKIRCPKIDWRDIVTLDLNTIHSTSNDIDESNLKETDVEKIELDENDNETE